MVYYPVAPNTPREKFTFEVRDMTNSHVLGTVESVSERGARQMGARRFNLPYAHVAVSQANPVRPAQPERELSEGESWEDSLALPADDDDTSKMSTMECAECHEFFGYDDGAERTAAALYAHSVHICLAEALPEVETVYREANPNAAHRVHGAHGIILDSERIALALPEGHTLDGEQMLIMAPGYSKVLIAGTEGVGIISADDGDTVGLYALRNGFEYVRVNIPRSVLWESTTNELCDIADFVRVFGGRLDGNAARLRRFAQSGE